MPKIMKSCRICGKEYEACRTERSLDGAFRWQSVACSPEHGEEYLQKLLDARAVGRKRADAPPRRMRRPTPETPPALAAAEPAADAEGADAGLRRAEADAER